MSGHFCRRAAQTNEGLAYTRFKQPSHSGDATRPRAAGRSLYRFPESVPCQPAFACPARGGFGRRDNRKRTGRGVASDGADPTRLRGRASRGGSFRPNARRPHFARDSESRYGPVSCSASASTLALPSHTSRHGRVGEIWARNRREKLLVFQRFTGFEYSAGEGPVTFERFFAALNEEDLAAVED